MNNQIMDIIEESIAYEFQNRDLLQQAFVRRSYAKENGGEDNEVLEFIGDKVLDIAVVKWLTDEYGFYCSECDDFDDQNDCNEFCCEKSEGQLTELKKRLVEKKTLANIISTLGLHEFLILGKGDLKNRIHQEDSVKEDLFESILGAVALDSEWNWNEIEDVVKYMLRPEERLSKNKNENYVELIQEWSLKECRMLPTTRVYHCDSSLDYSKKFAKEKRENRQPQNILGYEITANRGFHQPDYRCDLLLENVDETFVGFGFSKCEARQVACKLAYQYLEENDLLWTIRDEIENPNKEDAISQLEILARRGYFSIPTYDFNEAHDQNGNPVWTCVCKIAEIEKHYLKTSASKKEAKKAAAYQMLKHVLKG